VHPRDSVLRPTENSLDWEPVEGSVHCLGVDAWLRLPTRTWEVAAHDPGRMVLRAGPDASQVVIVTAARGSLTDQDIAGDWADALRQVLPAGAKPEAAKGALSVRYDRPGMALAGGFDLQPSLGATYRLAYRSVSRGLNTCRIAGLTAVPFESKDGVIAAAQPLEEAIVRVSATDLFALPPAVAQHRDAATDAGCVLDLMLVVLSGRGHLAQACRS
jgi:hypothetical protein